MTTDGRDNENDRQEVQQVREVQDPDEALAAGIATDNAGLITDLAGIATPIALAAADRVKETVKENRANRQHAEVEYAKDADDARRGAPDVDA